MPLPPADTQRTPKHVRAIRIEAFERDDGLWDLDARLTDTKPEPFELATGSRPAGAAVHDLWLRVTIDTRMNVVDARAASDAVPYPTHCDTIGPAYRALVGLNLLDGFRQGVRARLAGVAGCTHLTELTGVLPTAAIQAFAGTVYKRETAGQGDRQPFQLDRCHALRIGGEAVRRWYPRWYVAAKPASEPVDRAAAKSLPAPAPASDPPSAPGPAALAPDFQRIED